MTRNKQHIGSHNAHARPDGKMSKRVEPYPGQKEFDLPPMKTTARAVIKHSANKKRRQRDRTEAEQ